MDIRMTYPEKALLTGLLMNARRYVEFGSGGSTCLAASLVAESVISTDSSQEWHDRVREACVANKYPIQPTLIYVDIGKTGDWGWPIDASARDNWPVYYSAVWENPLSKEADFFLVDGRFRVACFMQVMLHAPQNALIAIHDFGERPGYQIVREVAREIQKAETLSIFRKREDYDVARASAILQEYAFQAE